MPGCELNSNKEADLEQAAKLIKNYNIDKGYGDIVSFTMAGETSNAMA